MEQADNLTAQSSAADIEAVLTGGEGGVGAYVDGLGGLYLTGYDGTMTANYAAQIVHVDENEVLYLAGEEIDDLGGTLMRLGSFGLQRNGGGRRRISRLRCEWGYGVLHIRP